MSRCSSSLNYEEGGENNILHGDAASEAFLSEIVGAAPWPGQRHWNMESIYEYGARAGFWRLHRLFTEAERAGHRLRRRHRLAALARPGRGDAGGRLGDRPHGYKWIDYKRHAGRGRARATSPRRSGCTPIVTGERPTGWYTGRSSLNTVELVAEEGGFDYVSDTYDDDLPYWRAAQGPRRSSIIPYTLAANDMRFVTAAGLRQWRAVFPAYLKDSFDMPLCRGQGRRARR